MTASDTATDKPGRKDLGKYLIVGGLILQLIAFSFFIVVTAVFNLRIGRRPTAKCASVQVPWLRYIYVLYGASFIIIIRSAFRVVEYIQGSDGYLMSHEPFAYAFDAALMILVSTGFNIFHPSKIVSRKATKHENLKNHFN
jgi:hypothetical protein